MSVQRQAGGPGLSIAIDRPHVGSPPPLGLLVIHVPRLPPALLVFVELREEGLTCVP